MNLPPHASVDGLAGATAQFDEEAVSSSPRIRLEPLTAGLQVKTRCTW